MGPSDIERVVLINLKRRPEKLAASLAEVSRVKWPFPTPKIFSAVDGEKVPSPEGWPAGDGAYGCRQSHVRILEEAILDDVRSILVLEDDLIFMPGFDESIEPFLASVPADWEGIWLGGQHMHPAEPTKIPGIVRCLHTERTHALMVRGQFLRALYRRWASSYAHVDHAAGPMMARYRVYAPEPFLVGQREGASDIDGQKHGRRYWSVIKREKPLPVVYLEVPWEVRHPLRRMGFHSGFYVDEWSCLDLGLEELLRSPVEEHPLRLAQWLKMICDEADQTEGLLPSVIHPGIAYADVVRATPREVLRATGISPQQVIGQLPEELRCILRGGPV